ncbi:glycoside hydrolase family 55 protein [Durotheca rogersii]|uniref:glycoside hydrolase family 55 protein n=1 Tax=Durotheca rogersii TaxID=419775 RepID=UPI00221EE215|nr:glycoside hydrolase family 55 protein [Durotheca rogersii]KAI5860346.1 glycoside hydrolase family 55 protein [Durotheca rogersii]
MTSDEIAPGEAAGLAQRVNFYREAAPDPVLPASRPVILQLDGHNIAELASRLGPRGLPDELFRAALRRACSDLLLHLSPRPSVAYVRSARVTLVFPPPSLETSPEEPGESSIPVFSNGVASVQGASRVAGYCSARFNAHLASELSSGAVSLEHKEDNLLGIVFFSSRTFAVPSVEEALHYLVWQCRSDDEAVQNSINHDGAKIVPSWALDSCVMKRELDQGGVGRRMHTRTVEGGFREFSADTLKLVAEPYWDEGHSPQPHDRGGGGAPTFPKPMSDNNTSVLAANQTIFGPNVYMFNPRMPASEIQGKATEIFKQMEANEFGPERYALLFAPGTYNVLFDVGFYTQVAGLGRNPDDVFIDGGVNVPAYWMPNRNATCNFWRSFENFSVSASAATNNTTTIAVSQAAPLRRLHIRSANGLWLFQVDPSTGAGGWASGGFMADSVVDGQVLPGSQQQWLSRNNRYGSWANAVWNMVFVGDANAPSQVNFPASPYTTVEQTPIIREKPYLYVTGEGHYEIFVPALQTETRGPSWANGPTPGESIPIRDFYVAHPSTTDAAGINTALDNGQHILFTPGIYKLDDALYVSQPSTVILGLGMPSLVPVGGRPALCVADVDGVTIAGLIIDASEVKSPALVEVGPPGSSVDHSANPTFLYDLTVRTVGGTANDVGITINSHNVVGDQLWLWRADHGQGAAWDSNPTRNGVVVNGDNVTIYGLFNEHHKEYQTLWNGDGGRVYFYQSEIPYDPPNQDSWKDKHGAVNGFASYKVADTVTSHEAWGLGIYSYFRDSPTKLENAIEVPDVEGVKLHHLTTIWLNGVPGSEITHIANGAGGRVYGNKPESAMRQTLTEFPTSNGA